MGDLKETCKNCEQEFKINYKFCPYCGQQTKDELTFKLLFYNTISNYFSFDARFLKSFLPLLLRPGYLARKFIDGKRLLYLHPAQLYLFISFIFFFLMSVLVVRNNVQSLDNALTEGANGSIIADSLVVEANKVFDGIKAEGLDDQQAKIIDSLLKTNTNTNLNSQFRNKKIDSLITVNAPNEKIYNIMGMDEDAGAFQRKIYAQSLKFYKKRNGGQILQEIYDAIPISLFILLPIFALILKLFFYKRGHYAHHLVFSFYYFSFLFVVFSLVLLANYFIDIPGWIDFLIVISTWLYLLIAIKRFYLLEWLMGLVKTSIISFVYLIFVIPIAIFVLFVFGFLSY
ncbi:DUF3667 domain-containing protein [Seonamhaeicola sp. MEBiC1930]|uniref:DUF3667 domain-containing protein n=1 Tax=Seonamhaeicola sp. MEBiC01930 TaxID=2976768 RepID=UPI00325366FC